MYNLVEKALYFIFEIRNNLEFSDIKLQEIIIFKLQDNI